MKFKELLKSDLDNVFFNSEEFAETHTVNGVNMEIILDEDLLKERRQSQQDLNDPTGYYNADVLFHVKKDVYGEKPAPGERITLDDKFYYEVADVEEDGGVYTIALEGRLS